MTDSADQWAMEVFAPAPGAKGLFVRGTLMVAGRKSSVVEFQEGDGVLLYAVESAEPSFEDFGSAKLQDGVATIQLDRDFLKAVNTSAASYLVFLTAKGPNPSLYVFNETPTSFEVRALGGPDISFYWRIVAKQKGHENLRLERIRIPRAREAAQHRNIASGELKD